MDFDHQFFREPHSVIMDFDNLPQHTMDLEYLGDITFRKRTIQRKRSSFRVFCNTYWNIASGSYTDGTRKKRYLRTEEDVRDFLRFHDYYDPVLNTAGTKGAPDGSNVVG